MRQDVLQDIEGLSPDVVEAVPDTAKILETTPDGGLIVKDRMSKVALDPHEAKQPKFDEDGNEVWRTNQQGDPVSRVHEYDDSEVVVKYKLEPRRTGKVVRNFDYETPEEEKERQRREAERESFLEQLADLAVERGMSPQELMLEMARGGVDAEEATGGDLPDTTDEPADQPPEDEGEVAVSEPNLEGPEDEEDQSEEKVMAEVEVGGQTAVMVGPGLWRMPDGSSERGNKKEIRAMLREHQEALSHMTEGANPEG